MKAIVAIDENFGIGKNGNLLLHNKEDMKFFKQTTMGHPVIMGRKTFESLPGVLKGRKNIVLTKHKIENTDIIVCNNYMDLINMDDAFVIGGGEIYKLFFPYYDEIFITKNKGIFDADTFFPRFDESLYSKEIITEQDTFSIIRYKKI